MKIIGIYKITNKVNGKMYIGSSIHIKKRWSNHRISLRKNKHDNIHLQNAWIKYGEENFQFEIIEECRTIEELGKSEENYINLHESYNRKKGYNLDRFVSGQKVMSHETKQKMSEWQKGEKHRMFGKHPSEETKKKMRENHWNNNGENHPLYGIGHSEKSKKKMSKSHKGILATMETKKKFSIMRKGEKNSNSKLTWEQVKEIRQKYIPRKYTQIMLANEYGVGRITILNIINNKNWKEE